MTGRILCTLALLASACQGPKGEPGPIGPMGLPGASAGSSDLAGVDLAGSIAAQPVSCTPGTTFCATPTRVGTCTLSGADAVLGSDCAAQGTTNNPGACVTTGCPPGLSACCRRDKAYSAWNFTQPTALVGESHFDNSFGKESVAIVRSCTPSGLGLGTAIFTKPLSACPSNAMQLSATFDRATVSPGDTVTLPSTGNSLYASAGTIACAQWTGSMKLDADEPNWSVTINATCTTAGVTLAVAGTFSGSE